MARPHTRTILCLAALWSLPSWGAEPAGNLREPSCVQGEASACAEPPTDTSPRAAARVQRSRAAALRRLLERAVAGRDDVATGLTVGRPDVVREVIGGRGRRVTCYLAESVVPCWREDEALRQLCSPELTRGQAVVEIAPGQALEVAPTGVRSRARVVTETPREIVIRCSTLSAELLVLRGTLLTGMDCTVDNVSRWPLRVNYVSYGVVVPPEEHEVRFLPRPSAPWLPMAVGVGALIGLGTSGVLVWNRRRKRRTVAEPGESPAIGNGGGPESPPH